MNGLREKTAKHFYKEHFEIVQSEIIPTRKIPAITNEPIDLEIFCRSVKIRSHLSTAG